MARTRGVIKNWFVRSERVKGRQTGLIQYSKYLVDENHKNHKKTHSIIPMFGNYNNFIQYATFQALNLDILNTQKRKGGRAVESYAQSFVFSLPSGIASPTPEQWKAITRDIIVTSAKFLELDPKQLGSATFSNVHDQHNPHLNLLIPRIFEGQRLEKLDQLGLISVMKKQFNASVLKHCQMNYKNYEPLETDKGKRVQNWAYQKEQCSKALFEVNEKIELQLEVGKAASEATEKYYSAAKLFKNFKNQIEKWMMAVRENDEKQEKRQENRIINTVKEIQELSVDEELERFLEEGIEVAEEVVQKSSLSKRTRFKPR